MSITSICIEVMFNNLILYEDDNNMNNKKTIKTILFASLIAAMILPFSTMDFATAQEADDRVEKLQSLRSEIANDKEAYTKAQHYDADLAIKRFDLAIAFVELENQGKGNSEEAQKIMSQLLETQSGIKYPNVIRNDNHEIGQIHPVGSYTYDTYSTNTVTRADCANQGTDYGSASGSITGYASSAYLVGTLSYPSNISDGSYPNCTNTNWSDHDMTYVLVGNPFVGCAQPFFTSSTDTEGGTCNNLQWGDAVLVTVATQKYGSTQFSSIYPSTVVTL